MGGSSSSMARLGGMATPFVSQVLIHAQPRPFLAFGLYILSCIISGVASILLPIETKGTNLKDVFDPKNDEDAIETDSLLPRNKRNRGQSVLPKKSGSEHSQKVGTDEKTDEKKWFNRGSRSIPGYVQSHVRREAQSM